MSISQPILPFLRPLSLPRPSTVRHFLRFSQSARTNVQVQQEPLSISRHPSSPSRRRRPSSSVSPLNPDRKPSAPHPNTPPPALQRTSYFVHRTASQQLPIYHLSKAGGNLHQTKVRKIEGDVRLLRDELQEALGLEKKDVVVNNLTKHVIVKGWHKPAIAKFLEERNF